MSRIGKKPIEIPSGVEVKIENNVVTVKGPKGTESVAYRDEVKVSVVENNIIVEPNSDDRKTGALHGLFRTLIANAVEGVSKGFVLFFGKLFMLMSSFVFTLKVYHFIFLLQQKSNISLKKYIHTTIKKYFCKKSIFFWIAPKKSIKKGLKRNWTQKKFQFSKITQKNSLFLKVCKKN